MKIIKWHLKTFHELSSSELYAILSAREQVFVIEQNSIYGDLDGLDQIAWHLYSTPSASDNRLMAYTRIIPPQSQSPFVSFGRVLVQQPYRGQGLGKQLVKKCLAIIEQKYPSADIKISAQVYLTVFYEQWGFVSISPKPYDDHGVLHVDMLKKVD